MSVSTLGLAAAVAAAQPGPGPTPKADRRPEVAFLCDVVLKGALHPDVIAPEIRLSALDRLLHGDPKELRADPLVREALAFHVYAAREGGFWMFTDAEQQEPRPPRFRGPEAWRGLALVATVPPELRDLYVGRDPDGATAVNARQLLEDAGIQTAAHATGLDFHGIVGAAQLNEEMQTTVGYRVVPGVQAVSPGREKVRAALFTMEDARRKRHGLVLPTDAFRLAYAADARNHPVLRLHALRDATTRRTAGADRIDTLAPLAGDPALGAWALLVAMGGYPSADAFHAAAAAALDKAAADQLRFGYARGQEKAFADHLTTARKLIGFVRAADAKEKFFGSAGKDDTVPGGFRVPHAAAGSDDPVLRTWAVRALAAFRRYPQPVGYMNRLLAAADDDTPADRVTDRELAPLYPLVMSAAARLEALAQGDPDPEVRTHAVFAVVSLPKSVALTRVDPLMGLARDKGQPAARRAAAVRAMSAMGANANEAIALYERLLRFEQDPELLFAAVRGLAVGSTHPGSVAALKEIGGRTKDEDLFEAARVAALTIEGVIEHQKWAAEQRRLNMQWQQEFADRIHRSRMETARVVGAAAARRFENPYSYDVVGRLYGP